LLFPFSVQALSARVLIDEKSLHQEVKGSFQLVCKNQFKGIRNLCPFTAGTFNSGTWKLEVLKDRLRITHAPTKRWQDFPGKYFSLKGKISFRGKKIQRLDLLKHKAGVEWVVHLPIDHYLYGVMGAEVPLSWPINALKAQAIASRTYFLYKRAKSKTHFDVRSDIMDQVFSIEAQHHDSILKAVDETHNMVLVERETNKVFPAYFHSDCGGQTSPESKVWRKPAAYNKPVKDPYCLSAKKNNWSYAVNKEKLMAVLHKTFYLPKGVELLNILPRLKAGKRAYIVDFLFSDNILKRISANDLRKVLGFTKLKSTNFSVKEMWQNFVFTGRGFGHGVGMCQWGAQRWARKGKGFQHILKHYYPQARLQKVDSVQLKNLQAQVAL
jgi:stage II sporulation protein D